MCGSDAMKNRTIDIPDLVAGYLAGTRTRRKP